MNGILGGMTLAGFLGVVCVWVGIGTTRQVGPKMRGALGVLSAIWMSAGISIAWQMQQTSGAAWWLSAVCGVFTLLVSAWLHVLGGSALVASPLTDEEHKAALALVEERAAEAEAHAAEAEARLGQYRELLHGNPFPLAMFGAPQDGMPLIDCNQAWLDFHGTPLVVEEAIGRSHYEMNPEVAGNVIFRAAHLRVARTGEPEAGDDDALGGRGISWALWRVSSGTASSVGLGIAARDNKANTCSTMPPPRVDAPRREGRLLRQYGVITPDLEALERQLGGGDHAND